MGGDIHNLLPNPLNISHLSLYIQLPLCSDLSCDLLDFVCNDGELVDHVVDGLNISPDA
jgi:hypothetical protein